MVSKFTFPHASFIGFEHLMDEFERLQTHDQTYPKHNVVKHSETNFSIELALAGYKKENIVVEQKEGILTVSGDQSDDAVNYLHKGISTKRFVRTFRLSEHVVVEGADLQDGLLVINLKVIVPEEKRPRIIPIGNSKQQLLTEEKK